MRVRVSESPGVSGDLEPWEGWGHVKGHVEAVSG